MASVSTIRDEIASALSAISGLRAHDIVPGGNLAVPAALVQLDSVDYDESMGRGLDRYTFTVRVYVAAQNDRVSQDKLDSYLAPSGSASVKAALETDRTLNGSVSSCRVTGASGVGIYSHGDVPYLGAEWSVDCYASGA